MQIAGATPHGDVPHNIARKGDGNDERARDN
jgi:hypothetical protein